MAAGFTDFDFSRRDGRALTGAALRRGLREMEGFVLAKNRPMLRLAARLGFSIASDPADAAVRICQLRLADA